MVSGTKAKWQLGEEFLFLHGSSINQVGERFTVGRYVTQSYPIASLHPQATETHPRGFHLSTLKGLR